MNPYAQMPSSETLRELIDLIGEEKCRALMHEYRGYAKIHIPLRIVAGHRIERAVGAEASEKLASTFGGEGIHTFSFEHKETLMKRVEAVRALAISGKKTAIQIGRELGVSHRWISDIAARENIKLLSNGVAYKPSSKKLRDAPLGYASFYNRGIKARRKVIEAAIRRGDESSTQIAARVGVTQRWVAHVAREMGIRLPIRTDLREEHQARRSAAKLLRIDDTFAKDDPKGLIREFVQSLCRSRKSRGERKYWPTRGVVSDCLQVDKGRAWRVLAAMRRLDALKGGLDV